MPRYEIKAWVTIEADDLESAESVRQLLDGYEITDYLPAPVTGTPVLCTLAKLFIEDGELYDLSEDDLEDDS